MLSYCRLTMFVIVTVAFSCISCSDYRAPKLPAKKPVVPVMGQVLVDGKPAEGIIVTLQPAASSQELYQFPTAVTDPDGQFKLGTYEEEDGAPAGDYIAIFVWPIPEEEQENEVDKLMRLYSEPAMSKIAVKVEDEPLELKPFDLKLAGLKGIPLSKQQLRELKMRKNRLAAANKAE